MTPNACVQLTIAILMPLSALSQDSGLAAVQPSLRSTSRFGNGASDGASGRRLNSVLSWFAVRAMGLFTHTESVELFGTTFTADNYQRDMIDFATAGMTNDNGLASQAWNVKGTGQTQVTAGLVRSGPGPNTETILGFNDTVHILSQYAAKIDAGKIERGNELGMQILGSGAWPEAPGGLKSIGLGQTRDNHAFVRPYLANSLDKNGSWSDDWLEKRAEAFFTNRHKVESSDLRWWIAQLLHKIHVDLDIAETDAKEFASYMSSIVLLIPFSEMDLQGFVLSNALSVQTTLAKKASYLDTLKSAIRAKYADEAFVSDNDEEKITLLASVFLDSLQFAGGISVPTVLQYVLALTHRADDSRQQDLKGVRLSTDNYEWILWETLRRYAPVAGVPSWEKQADGSFKHVVPKLTAALQDSSVFEDPLEFKNRGQAAYESKLNRTGLPWAGPAVHEFSEGPGKADSAAPHSHNCPAQDLSLRIMKAFLKAFIARGGSMGWAAVDDSISVNNYAASSFSLIRRGHEHSTGCMLLPECEAGYSWVKTDYCSWGRRSWTCQVP
jgi:hypothetical protein